ncbi:isochorismatase [Vibrio anguillarum]|uniref:Isochorismatase n=1 Tax=Vibrio anguillarum TaxID=55601 RepID=A0ABR9Z566_VIBAN|nr:isochorismatase [Vibrio anguillarum]MBF4245218.1 isochorismatase [Vibrio anguillarum]MBF4373578.1 isochorismatase [Vibrio anguillarum]
MVNNSVLAACQQGIEAWQSAFNQQDAKGCADQYISTSTMHARPFGVFEGKSAIEAFWQDIMDEGFKEVSYTNVYWEPAGQNGYILTAEWQMNKAFGVIHKEHWVVESDGKARLASDDFEVLGER